MEIKESTLSYLGDYRSIFEPEFFSEIGSTNDYLKEIASKETKTWHTVIASAQTAGRGRQGRSFSSPAETGLYLSILLRPTPHPELAVRITTAAAVAACQAIEACTDEHPQIKWVNDVFLHDKKVCGILTEASVNPDSRELEWAVMGIGFNVYEPNGGFPDELKDIAGPISEKKIPGLRGHLAAEFLKDFYRICSNISEADHSEEYKKRCFVIGRDINVISGDSIRAAKAVDINKECHLIVRYEDGTLDTLSSGEISIRLKDH